MILNPMLACVCAALIFASTAQAATVSTDSPRDPNLPPSQDFSHVASTFDPASGTWSVAYTFFGPPSADAWGNLSAELYTGASQCLDFQAEIASFQQAATLPGDSAVSATVIPPPDRMLRPAESKSKTIEGDTITLTMVDSSLVGAAPTCVQGAISHRGFLDSFGPLPFPDAPPVVPVPPEPGTTPPPAPPRLMVAVKSTHLTASRTGIVKVALKPFNQDAAGAVTFRSGGKLVTRGSYKAKTGKTVSVTLKLPARSLRTLKRHRSLALTLSASAQAGAQVVTKTARVVIRGRAG